MAFKKVFKNTLVFIGFLNISLLFIFIKPAFAADKCFNLNIEFEVREEGNKKGFYAWAKFSQADVGGYVQLEYNGVHVAGWDEWSNYPNPFVYSPKWTQPYDNSQEVAVRVLSPNEEAQVWYRGYVAGCSPQYEDVRCEIGVIPEGIAYVEGEGCYCKNCLNSKPTPTPTPTPTKAPTPTNTPIPTPTQGSTFPPNPSPTPTPVLTPTTSVIPTPTFPPGQGGNLLYPTPTISLKASPTPKDQVGGQNFGDLQPPPATDIARIPTECSRTKEYFSYGYFGALKRIAGISEEDITLSLNAIEMLSKNYKDAYAINIIEERIYTPIVNGLERDRACISEVIEVLSEEEMNNFLAYILGGYAVSGGFSITDKRKIIKTGLSREYIDKTLGKEINFIKKSQKDNKSKVGEFVRSLIPRVIKVGFNAIVHGERYDSSGELHRETIKDFLLSLKEEKFVMTNQVLDSFEMALGLGGGIVSTLVGGRFLGWVASVTGIDDVAGRAFSWVGSRVSGILGRGGGAAEEVAQQVVEEGVERGIARAGRQIVGGLDEETIGRIIAEAKRGSAGEDVDTLLRNAAKSVLRRNPTGEEMSVLRREFSKSVQRSGRVPGRAAPAGNRGVKYGQVEFPGGTAGRVVGRIRISPGKVLNLAHGQDAASVVEVGGKRIGAAVADGVSSELEILRSLGYSSDAPTREIVNKAAELLSKFAKGEIDEEGVKAGLRSLNRELVRKYQGGEAATFASAVVKGDNLSVFWTEDSRVFAIYKNGLIDLITGNDIIQLARSRSDIVSFTFGDNLVLNHKTLSLSYLKKPRLLVATDGFEKVVGMQPGLRDKIIQIIYSSKTPQEAEGRIISELRKFRLNEIDDIAFAVIFP